MGNEKEIVLFETEDKSSVMPVTVENESVWLNRNQISTLFERDVKTIGKHINNALKEEFDVPDDGMLVDIGCGGGFNIRRLLDRSKDGFVYGIDISSTSVEKSKKTNKKNIGKRCEVLLGSAENLPLKDNSIKLATAFETVYFWKDLEKCFAEVKRTIRPGGKFVVVNDPGDPEKHWEKMIPGMKSYTPDEIKQIMEAVGFMDVKVTKNKFMFCVSGKKGN
ncbi:hypothetical protein Lac2_14870 [Claveliimonas bilis]|uniref:methyltransferase domain-containing protein n=1 Tax=Claveliimonas bilis TaxID=3028070 RepID=UPI00292EF6B1|nr:class I SAM-dependent methyltransferase [Claveliimonas bilis]BDZ83353.1 hypothetical protein Lac2_14870 [Claveliimonas bilis]